VASQRPIDEAQLFGRLPHHYISSRHIYMVFGDFLLRAPEFYPIWDQRVCYKLARVARSLVAHEPNAWAPFKATLGSEYNAVFGLPLSPALMAFGEPYYVYGMAVAVIYGTTASLAVAAVAVVILTDYRPSVIFSTFAARLCHSLSQCDMVCRYLVLSGRRGRACARALGHWGDSFCCGARSGCGRQPSSC